jgi:hypothetical protein
LVFNDNIIVPTIVSGPSSERDTLKDPEDIDFYINRKKSQSENGFFIEDSYTQNKENKIYVILENKNNPKTLIEFNKNKVDLEYLIKLFKIDFRESKAVETDSFFNGNTDYKQQIIIESAKQKVILDQEKLKDGIFNMNHLELIEVKQEVTLFDLKSDDPRIDNPIILRIKTN